MLRIVDAMRIKGLRLEGRNPIPYVRALPRLIIPAIFTIVRRSASMMGVLQLRGYQFRTRRQLVALERWGALDGALVALALAGVALALWGNIANL